MARDPLQTLSEPMFYLLLSLREEKSGAEIFQYISDLTDNRIKMGPGTLYALLARFVDDELIYISSTNGKRKNYKLTDEGRLQLEQEFERLKQLVDDYRKVSKESPENLKSEE
ncbi:MAG: helix-turn-helix transcriptional regulator [Clostridiaceae bacterium]